MPTTPQKRRKEKNRQDRQREKEKRREQRRVERSNVARGEAFVPLPDGRSIPVDMRGGGERNLVVNITAMDSQDVARALTKNRSTLLSLWLDDLARSRIVRQQVKGAAS